MLSKRKYYIFKDGKITFTYDVLKWAESYESCDRNIKKTKIGDMEVSTVFLGIDHNYFGEGDPILFETMIFGESYDQQYQERCCTYEQALIMHKEACKVVRIHKKAQELLKEGIAKEKFKFKEN